MKRLPLLALAAAVLAAPRAGAAQVAQPLLGGEEDRAQITAVGRVQASPTLDRFVLQVKNFTFQVRYRQNGSLARPTLRAGDRVRVSGELTAFNQLEADQVQVLGGNRRPTRVSSVLRGMIADINRDAQRLTVDSGTGTVRVTWDEDTEFIRNTVRSGPREFRPGDGVRVVGRRSGNQMTARRVLYGGSPGWSNNAIGEIVGLDSRAQELEVDFEGEVAVVQIRGAALRRSGRAIDLNDLRLGQDVRVGGRSRGGDTVEATLVEVVRQIDERGGSDGALRLEGRVVNVAEGRRTFRISLAGGSEARIITDEKTRYQRGTRSASFRDVAEGQRVRVRVQKQGDDYLAVLVELP